MIKHDYYEALKFGALVKAMRIACDRPVPMLADLLGCSTSRVRQLETGYDRKPPSEQTLSRIGDIFDRSPEHLRVLLEQVEDRARICATQGLSDVVRPGRGLSWYHQLQRATDRATVEHMLAIAATLVVLDDRKRIGPYRTSAARHYVWATGSKAST